MKELIRQAKSEMRRTKQEQENLYNKHVLSKIIKGDDPDTVGEGYQEYLKDIGSFHALAFEQVIDHILEDDNNVLDKFASGFESIPEYIVHRSGWLEKKDGIMQDDSPAYLKLQSIKMMDRLRTNAHDGVINLFNDMNSYAEDKNLPTPYPMSYGKFDKKDSDHRRDVAQILIKHSPLLEKVNMIVQEKSKETDRTETLAEKYQRMSLEDLFTVAKQNTKQSDLPDLGLEGLSQ